jgi:hypothetical protein
LHKGIWAGTAAALLLWIGSWSYGDSPVNGGGPPAASQSSGLITHHLAGGATGDHLVVIDPVTKVIAVYRIHKEHGEVKLASVRRIDADLQVLSFNTDAPLPHEVRAGLERQARY